MKKNSYIILSIIFSIINVITATFIPVFIGKLIDFIVIKDMINFKSYTMISIIFILVATITYYLMEYYSKKYVLIICNNYKKDMTNKVLNAKMKLLDKYNRGTISSIFINDINNVYEGNSLFLINFIPGIITVLLMIILMIRINIRISLIIILLTPISILTTYLISLYTKKYFRSKSVLNNEIGALVKEDLDLEDYIKIERIEEYTYKNLEKLSNKYRELNKKSIFYSSLANPTSRLINGMITVVVLFMGTKLILNGYLSVGSLTTLIIYAGAFSKPLNNISNVLTQISTSKASKKNIDDILNLKIEDSNTNEFKFNDKIVFDNVTFGYNKNKILNNFNLVINKNDSVAITGKTGSGKTTLINLLLRFYDPLKGNIMIDDMNINKININSLRENFKVVTQDIWLSSESILESIKYKNNATNEDIINLLKELKIKPSSIGLSNDLNNMDNSVDNLSVGQKQIISILRVLLFNPKLVILDEATSNIDLETEENLKKVINKLMKKSTTIIIAHRLSTIEACNKVIDITK